MSKTKKETTTESITPVQYSEYFRGKEDKALERAQDIRKFEIDLYWKRATYFWTFIGATLAGFLAIQASGAQNKQDLSVILSCLGVVFSFAWLCVNRGSKFWQENWEKHVDILENEVTGPLYKVILSRNLDDYTKSEKVRDWVTGPSALSVSKINQLISLYVSILWVLLLWYSLPPFDFAAQANWFYCGLIGLSVATCVSFVFKLGRTYSGGYWHNAELRKSRIKPANNQMQPTPKDGVAD
ncbi:MAG: hypothetical protein CMN25_00490 [Salinicola sp.]|uniref:RipA family octameric membrane protein n=1 Tax=uncultured Salinicola sp. TaxID=1193542 RepID=UPI000C8A1F39|nr:hypothetical protein [uncultured Salinicola sp.]MAM55802.1 hypothetical protein [Salinicola sp.]|tara:strand:+ start:2641 stop:3363 length:723 start_codon:yes stop_codon:yes gene_type:complete